MLEQIFVRTECEGSKIVLGAVYIPPDLPPESYRLHCVTIEEIMLKHPDHKFAIFGDFNLRYLKWSNDPLAAEPVEYVRPEARDNAQRVINCYTSLGASQVYPTHPSKGYTLDLLFFSPQLATPVEDVEQLITTDIHHLPAVFELSPYVTKHKVARCPRLDFSRADYAGLNSLFSEINWESTLGADDLDVSVDSLYSVINEAITSCVPIKSSTPCTYPLWYSNNLINLIRQKKVLHCKWKSSSLLSDYIEFKRVRAMCIRNSKSCYRAYISTLRIP